MAKIERFLAWFFYSVGLAFVVFAILIAPPDLFAYNPGECSACQTGWPAGSAGRADCAVTCCTSQCTEDACKSQCCTDACGTDNACLMKCTAETGKITCGAERCQDTKLPFGCLPDCQAQPCSDSNINTKFFQCGSTEKPACECI